MPGSNAPPRAKNGRHRKGKRSAGSGELSPRQIKRNEQRQMAVQMRLAGWPFSVIAREMGLSNPGLAHALVDEAMSERLMPAVDELRERTMARLEEALTGVFNSACQGDLNAMDRLLAIVDRQRQISGMDRPVRIKADVNAEVSVSGEISHVNAAPLRIVFVRPDGQEIEGTLTPPPKLTNGGNGHG